MSVNHAGLIVTNPRLQSGYALVTGKEQGKARRRRPAGEVRRVLPGPKFYEGPKALCFSTYDIFFGCRNMTLDLIQRH